MMANTYRIQVMKSERGWGQDFWTEEFDTLEEAQLRIREINSQNTSFTAPDYYMQAQTGVEVIESGT
jgi:hypothetical protein